MELDKVMAVGVRYKIGKARQDEKQRRLTTKSKKRGKK